MKKILVILVAIIVIALFAVYLVFRMTGGLTETAEAFFSAVGAQDLEKAYGYTAAEFRAHTPFEDFQAYLQRSALSDYRSASWSSRSVSGGKGELEGTIRTAGGGAVPLKLTLVKEAEGWRILSIQKAAAGIVGETESGGLPGSEVTIALVRNTLQDFALAVNRRNFDRFYANISNLWQGQISAEKLAEIFRTFSDQQIDLTVLQGMQPVFDREPEINEQKILLLQGHYDTQPSVTRFTLKYIFEPPAWKLMGINVEVK